jgi:hypothetical protein
MDTASSCAERFIEYGQPQGHTGSLDEKPLHAAPKERRSGETSDLAIDPERSATSVMKWFRQLLAHSSSHARSTSSICLVSSLHPGTSRRLAEPVLYISSPPDQGDSCIMQNENGGVNDYVVIILMHYIIVGAPQKKTPA